MKEVKQWMIVLFTAVIFTACSSPTELTGQMVAQPTAPTIIIEPTATHTAVPTNTPIPTHEPCVAPNVPYPPPRTAEPVPVYGYEIINSYPHDAEAFTQGLVWEDGMFYEGTGLNGRSSLRLVEPETGTVDQSIPVEEQYFGEGITIWEDEIIQLTWQSEIAFVYDKESFEKVGEFSYVGEGWGLTHDGRCLIMSNGSDQLSFRDPETFAEVGRIAVYDGDSAVFLLNELEYIDGEIFANVWQTNRIARIDPDTGQVTGWIDLTNLLDTSTLTQPVDVLNGIAFDWENGRIFVTGKWWPTLYEIELIQE